MEVSVLVRVALRPMTCAPDGSVKLFSVLRDKQACLNTHVVVRVEAETQNIHMHTQI